MGRALLAVGYAQWRQNANVFYFDRARREDGHLIIWELGNVLPPHKWLHASATGTVVFDTYSSVVMQKAYDCKRRAGATLVSIIYKNEFEKGEIVQQVNHLNEPRSWQPLLPNTQGEDILERACDGAKAHGK